MIRKACAMIDSCKPVILTWQMEEFMTQSQLNVEKERLEIEVRDLKKNLAAKSEEIQYFHAK